MADGQGPRHGDGQGVNAILAATRGCEVVGVDLNPEAVSAGRANAERNGVGERITFLAGDLFTPVEGTFDLVVYDPPFRWFAPRDLVEASMADEGYQTLGRFMSGVGALLRPGGRVLVFFGTSGDLAHLVSLAENAGLEAVTVADRSLTRGNDIVRYPGAVRFPAPPRQRSPVRVLPIRLIVVFTAEFTFTAA